MTKIRLPFRRLQDVLATAFSVVMLAIVLVAGSSFSLLAQPAPQPSKSAPQVLDPRLNTLPVGDMWRAVRKGVSGRVSIPDDKAGQLVQSEGDNWRSVKNGPLAKYSAWALAGMVALLALFFLLRGRIRIEQGFAGTTITRFMTIERMAHWLLAVSFIVLALTGLNVSYGKFFLLPVVGKETFATLTSTGKLLHNYVAFAFMTGLVMVLVLWIKDNIPSLIDLKWIAKGGGLFSKGVHPPSRKFNAGQKVIFWLVILGGLSLSLSGISLLFPFQTALFAKTFAVMNVFGFNLPTDITPVQEMQLAALWHSIISVVLTCVILAHIYIGSIGMEGAFDAMGTGEVDLNWAKEHHGLWVKEVQSEAAGPGKPASAGFIPAE